jgi:hypothetical protein
MEEAVITAELKIKSNIYRDRWGRIKIQGEESLRKAGMQEKRIHRRL